MKLRPVDDRRMAGDAAWAAGVVHFFTPAFGDWGDGAWHDMLQVGAAAGCWRALHLAVMVLHLLLLR